MKKSLLVVFLLVLLWINTTNIYYESFTDEYDNLYGGQLITRGLLPYTGFFSHHGPVAYFFAAGIELFTGKDFLMFRFVYQYILWFVEVLLIFFLWKYFNFREAVSLIAYFIVSAISLNYFWGHLLVADNLAAFLLSGAYILLLYQLKQKTSDVNPRMNALNDTALAVKLRRNHGRKPVEFHKLIFPKRHPLKLLFIISLLGFLGLFTSYTFVFAVILIHIFSFYSFSKFNFLKVLILIFVPYIFLAIYLLLTQSFDEMYFQTVTFNRENYVYAEAAQAKNLFALGALIFLKFLNTYKEFLNNLVHYSLNHPFVPTLMLANTALWIQLILTRKFKAFLFSLLIIIFVNVRNNPLSEKLNDFQSAPYILISIFNGVYFLTHSWQVLFEKKQTLKRVLFSFLFIIMLTFSYHFYRFVFDRWSFDYREKQSSKEIIYQSHPVSPFLNPLLKEDDYFFIGPFDPESNFYTIAKPTSRYYFFVPAMEKSSKIHQELLENILKNKPKIIVYHTEYNIFGHEPGKDLIKTLLKDYTTLEYIKGNIKYTPKIKWLGSFRYDLERHFFIRKEFLEEILTKMDALDFIQLD